jgi:hypothetical protein
MRFLYEANIPFVILFLAVASGLALFNWRGRRR